jgi:hypothetical protein
MNNEEVKEHFQSLLDKGDLEGATKLFEKWVDTASQYAKNADYWRERCDNMVKDISAIHRMM